MEIKGDIKGRKTKLQIHHELRTPLNVILGFIQILSSNPNLTDEEKEGYLSIIEKTSFKLLYQIDGIMDKVSFHRE